MARYSRIIVQKQPSAYHVSSRTALDGLPFGAADKDHFIKLLQHYSSIYFTEILGFCIMDDHFHLLTRMHTEDEYSDEEIEKRHTLYYGDGAIFNEKKIFHLRQKWENLSELIKDLKQNFTRYYNKKKGRRGTLWGERFKSTLVEDGDALIACKAYIDLNPVRAGICKKPDRYRWNSLNQHDRNPSQTNWISLNLGLPEYNSLPYSEKVSKYKDFIYESGEINNGFSRKKNRKKNRHNQRHHRFLNRTRYFTDSVIIGSKEFVRTYSRRFKHFFTTLKEKEPIKISGINGLYSLREIR